MAVASHAQPGHVLWWIETQGKDGKVSTQAIGAGRGEFPIALGENQVGCSYDAVDVAEGAESRWLRCELAGWHVRTIAACSVDYYVPSGVAATDVDEARKRWDHSVVLASRTDTENFGVGLRCLTEPDAPKK